MLNNYCLKFNKTSGKLKSLQNPTHPVSAVLIIRVFLPSQQALPHYSPFTTLASVLKHSKVTVNHF